MSEEKEKLKMRAAIAFIFVVLTVLNLVPSVLFQAYTIKTIWNMFNTVPDYMLSTSQCLAPMLVLNFVLGLAMSTVDCTKPERDTTQLVGYFIGLIVRPYVAGLISLSIAWIMTFFV